MSTRDQHIEFHLNYCVHYKPKLGSLKSDYCAIGRGASAMMQKAHELGLPDGPCIGGHAIDATAVCAKWERRSLESAEKQADSIERLMRRMTVVMPVINDWRKKLPFGKEEVIECPECRGRLHLVQSNYNAHVRARCETDNCVNFIE